MHAGQGSQHGRWIYVGEGKSALETEVGPQAIALHLSRPDAGSSAPEAMASIGLVTLRTREPGLPAGAPRPPPSAGVVPGPGWQSKPGGPRAPGADGVCGPLAAGQRFPSDSRGEVDRRSRRSPACLRPAPSTRGPYASVPVAPPPGGARALRRTGSWGTQWGQSDGRLASSRYAAAPSRSGARSPQPLVYRTLPPPSLGGLPPLWHVPALWVAGGPGEVQVRYLVDSASSHMLVSKIKPCMSKYKQLVL